MDAAIWGLIGTLLGASTSILTTVITNGNAFRLQNNSDILERTERARTFQRENLIQTQNSLQDFMRFIGRAHIEDHDAYLENGEWGKNMLGNEINEGIFISNQKLLTNIERIADDSLRAEIKSLWDVAHKTLFNNSARSAQSNLNEVISSYPKVMESLGRVLRSYY